MGGGAVDTYARTSGSWARRTASISRSTPPPSSRVRAGRRPVRPDGQRRQHPELVELAEQLGITDMVTFTGRVPDEVVSEVLSTADLGLCPDPLNPLNDVSTMNKTMEYMAFELPGRRLRPEGDPGLRRRRRDVRRAERRRGVRPRDRGAPRRPRTAAGHGSRRASARRRPPGLAPPGAALRRRLRAALRGTPGPPGSSARTT